LTIRNLTKYFGGLAALYNVDLDVFESEILGVIGPNGAGKTTLFNMTTGILRPTSGRLKFNGEDITGLKSHKIAQMGIGRTFQASVLFMEATVFENVFTAFHMQYKQPGWKAFLHTPSAKKEQLVIKQKVTEILEFMDLAPVKDKRAVNLPHGYQRMLGVCLALASAPRLTSGEIWFQGKRIDGLPAHKIAQLGITHIPEGRRLFAPMTVLENLEMGAYLRKNKGKIAKQLESIYEHFNILRERRNQKAGSLSGGEQQMLALARALMSQPRLLLMDEPSMGLSPTLVDEVARIIRDINRVGRDYYSGRTKCSHHA